MRIPAGLNSWSSAMLGTTESASIHENIRNDRLSAVRARVAFLSALRVGWRAISPPPGVSATALARTARDVAEQAVWSNQPTTVRSGPRVPAPPRFSRVMALGVLGSEVQDQARIAGAKITFRSAADMKGMSEYEVKDYVEGVVTSGQPIALASHGTVWATDDDAVGPLSAVVMQEVHGGIPVARVAAMQKHLDAVAYGPAPADWWLRVVYTSTPDLIPSVPTSLDAIDKPLFEQQAPAVPPPPHGLTKKGFPEYVHPSRLTAIDRVEWGPR